MTIGVAMLLMQVVSAGAAGNGITRKVNKAVMTVRKDERKLERPLTPWGHHHTAYSLRVWTARARLWTKRMHDVRWVIRAVFPSADQQRALCITWTESRWNNGADNPSSTAAGPWQFLDTWYAGNFNPYDPWASTKRAWKQVRTDGWSPWHPDCGA